MDPSRLGYRDLAPRHVASNAGAPHPRPLMPIFLADTHMSRNENASPTQVLGTLWRPPARCGLRPLVYPMASFRHRACRSARASPAAESNCQRTFDSRACTDYFSNRLQTPRSIDRPHRQLPGLPLPVCTRPKPTAWEYSTTSLCPKDSSRCRLISQSSWPVSRLRSGSITELSSLLRATPPLCLASVLRL